MINPEILRGQALEEIRLLRERERHPEITADIDAVWVLSGPGTYYQPTKNSESWSNRWMDRDRIRMGVAIVKEVTAARIRGSGINPDKKGHNVTKDEIIRHGPYFIYNGIPAENEAFRKVIATEKCTLPWKKVILIDTAEDNGQITPIRHTLDQFKSLPSFLFAPNGIVRRKLATVSNAEHYPRIWRYFRKWIDMPENVRLVSFTIPTREASEEYSCSEANRVVEYSQRGHLAPEPIHHDQ